MTFKLVISLFCWITLSSALTNSIEKIFTANESPMRLHIALDFIFGSSNNSFLAMVNLPTLHSWRFDSLIKGRWMGAARHFLSQSNHCWAPWNPQNEVKGNIQFDNQLLSNRCCLKNVMAASYLEAGGPIQSRKTGGGGLSKMARVSTASTPSFSFWRGSFGVEPPYSPD